MKLIGQQNRGAIYSPQLLGEFLKYTILNQGYHTGVASIPEFYTIQ